MAREAVKRRVICADSTRLVAASILSRSPHELAEIASLNPAIYDEWMSEIGRRSAAARAEAQRLSMALESLRRASSRGHKAR